MDNEANTTLLKSLVGKHTLSGVDRQSIRIDFAWLKDAEQINFVLDGITYTAVEDPEDGYRSCLHRIFVSDSPVINVFPDVPVIGKMRESSNYEVNETIEFYDIENGKLILAVGTNNTDDYYPYWVADFNPQDIHYNKEVEG